MPNVINIRGFARAFTSVVYARCMWLVLAIACMSFTPHPYYLGVTDISYNTKTTRLELSVKLFTNDLEDALRKTSGSEVDVLHPKDKAAVEKCISDYITKRLELKADQKTVTYHLLGYEKEEEAVWIYFESGELPAPKKLEVRNRLLFDYLPQQINIVHASINGHQQSGKVTNPDDKFSFNF